MKKGFVKGFLKNLFAGFVIGVVIGALITALVVYTQAFIDKLISNVEFSTGVLALATIVLAGFTFWNIQSHNAQEKRERKERLLNEITEWAIDSARPKYALELTSLDHTLSEKDQENIIQLSQSSYTQMLKIKGDYLCKIASGFTQSLSTAVENLTKELDKHSELIDDWMEAKVSAKDIGSHEYKLTESANEVLKEAAKLKLQALS